MHLPSTFKAEEACTKKPTNQEYLKALEYKDIMN